MRDLKKAIRTNNAKYSLGIAFVTFKTKRMADYIESSWGVKPLFKLLRILRTLKGGVYKYRFSVNNVEKVSNVSIRRAPDPNDILWENLGVSYSKKLKRRLITFSVTFLLLCLSFGAILGLKIAQYELYTGNHIDTAGLRTISFLITAVIATINFLLNFLITKLTRLEKHDTQSSYFRSLLAKKILSGLVNSNLLVIIAHVAVYRPTVAIYGKGTLR